MKTVVIANQKGGVGKSTLTGHLSVAAAVDTRGIVAIMDTDPQGSMVDWWNARDGRGVEFVVADVPNLKEQLNQLRAAGVELVIIDTPPAITETVRAVIACADAVLIPTRPSPHDLRAIPKTVELVEAAGLRPIFVINGAAHRARITAEAAIALSKFGEICDVVLHHRTDFASAMTDGGTVQELNNDSKSAAELTKLWKYIKKHLASTKEAA